MSQKNLFESNLVPKQNEANSSMRKLIIKQANLNADGVHDFDHSFWSKTRLIFNHIARLLILNIIDILFSFFPKFVY